MTPSKLYSGRSRDVAVICMLVAVHLVDWDLWERFNEHQNEMIITRSGRCLFPLLKLRFHRISEMELVYQRGPVIRLQEGHRYSIGLAVEPADGMRWRYRIDGWRPILANDYRHPVTEPHPLTSSSSSSSQPSSPILRLRGPEKVTTKQIYEPVPFTTPEDLIANGISFSRVKLNNQQESGEGTSFSLTSFHRYQPTIYLLDHESDTRSLRQILVEEPSSPGIIKFSFPCINFIAVTHYQNEAITALKKSHNPHAKGFLSTNPVGGRSKSPLSIMEGRGDFYSLDDEDESEGGSSPRRCMSEMSEEERIATQTLVDMRWPSPLRR